MELDIFVKNASYSSTLQFCYVHITSCSLFAFKSHPAILYAKMFCYCQSWKGERRSWACPITVSFGSWMPEQITSRTLILLDYNGKDLFLIQKKEGVWTTPEL